MGESLETITLLGVKPTRGDWAARSNFPASFGSALGSACICASARRSRNKRLFLSGSPPGILPAGADAANASLAMSTPPAAHAAARSEEHTSELQSLMRISYAVFCLKQKKNQHLQLRWFFKHVLHKTRNN